MRFRTCCTTLRASEGRFKGRHGELVPEGLSWALPHGTCTGGAGLAAYQERRAARAARIVEAANRNARAYHLSGPLRSFAHLGLRVAGAVAPQAALARFDWLYDHDVTRGG